MFLALRLFSNGCFTRAGIHFKHHFVNVCCIYSVWGVHRRGPKKNKLTFSFAFCVLHVLLYFRCHSYRWTNRETGKTTKELLQEMLAASEKTWHKNSGKKMNTNVMEGRRALKWRGKKKNSFNFKYQSVDLSYPKCQRFYCRIPIS